MEPWTIVLPTRPQPDTIVALFLLTALGKERFPGIGSFRIEVNANAPEESFDALVEKRTLLMDIGGGPLDHHGTGKCTSELVAEYLGIRNDPAIARLLQYAKRDDAHGKGTLSSDPVDRAFGLSGLIASLNKQFPGEADRIVKTVLPLLEAHYAASYQHHHELPAAVEEKKGKGEYTESFALQGKTRLKIAFVVSDRPGMVTYLRSFSGPRADVVVQRGEQGNRVCIVSRQERHVNLSIIAALIRMKEAELRGVTLPSESSYAAQDGKIQELPMWYVDPATNSILNVGNSPSDDTRIPWDELQRFVRKGIELAPPK